MIDNIDNGYLEEFLYYYKSLISFISKWFV